MKSPSTGDGERFIDRARRHLNLDSRRGGYQLYVLLFSTTAPRPMYGLFRLVAGGARLALAVRDHHSFVSDGVRRALDTSVGAMSNQPAQGKLQRDNQSPLAAARLLSITSVYYKPL